jgi:imidazoleglycerol-phosphate dehydratase
MRKAEIKRKTKETEIVARLNIDGKGNSKIVTGIGILDHMLELFSFHGLFDLELVAKGDLNRIDMHHTNEDIGIVLGQAFKKALADKKGIKRFGFGCVPMEDVLADVALDISGRGFFNQIILQPEISVLPESNNGYCLEYANHFFEALAKNMGINLSIRLSGTNPDLHTDLEPIFKAFGLALDGASQIDPRRKGIPSTKGIID